MTGHQAGDSIDGFVLKEPLGEGAYATVWLAIDQRGDREVVVKFPNPELLADPQLYARFTRERTLALSLEHPNVQRALPVPQHPSEPYLLHEYRAGQTLREWMAQRERVPLEEAIDIGRQIALGLAYLHAHGVVHRDLKPENLIISADHSVAISDFGSAVSLGARRLTWRHFSMAQGTPDYMSPEQIRGQRGDARSDLYSWGIILYELLTGVVPFEGDSWLVVMAGHLQGDPLPLRERDPGIPPEVEGVVMHSFRRYPEHRYQRVDELLRDLNEPATIDSAVFDFSVEAPMGEVQPTTTRSYLRRAGLVAVGFVSAIIAVVVIALVVR
ncbi:serine/threonine-protein kinase [Ferrimicrobium sp.]|uniref:serine/threonine-protein kinase n=1 Tax=Ferrimicrobium sp. TaxID=2926050 RepID=UPI00261397A1|nr:serine/threonine-protein kinase [Ferrimicrobium sp.]